MIEPYDWRAMTARNLLAAIVYCKLKPIFEMDVPSDRIDLRDSDGPLIIFSKDTSASFPRLIMETTKFHKSGKTELIARDCFGMDCGLEAVNEAVTSMAFERCRRIVNEER